ncbi:hypothetical protein D6C92_10658, partial [Aureobasidium pullulans]
MPDVVLDDVLDEDVVALEIVALDVVIDDIVLVVVLSEDWDVTLEDVFVDVFEEDFAVLEDVFVCEVDDVGLEKVDFDELMVFEVVLHVVFDVYAELELGVLDLVVLGVVLAVDTLVLDVELLEDDVLVLLVFGVELLEDDVLVLLVFG